MAVSSTTVTTLVIATKGSSADLIDKSSKAQRIQLVKSCPLLPSTKSQPFISSGDRIDKNSKVQRIQLEKSGLLLPSTKCQPFQNRKSILKTQRLRGSEVLCAAALNSRCAAEQTQTVTRQSSTITVAPIQGKEKSPELDDGGTGFPPRDDDGGGGGGGGGGHHWSGGFFFFGLLAFLGLLKDQESEGPYRDSRRRR